MARWNKTQTKYRSAKEHYDAQYSRDQTRDGDLRGTLNAWKFEPFTSDRRRILDFGCGDGALLKALGGSFGVEINPDSAALAREKGLEVAESLDEFDDGFFDLVVSNHCLEHVEEPLRQLREMRRVLREDGLLAIVVPCHNPGFGYKEKDRDFHLYSWSAANLGNLTSIAGFSVLESKELLHRWPPKWRLIYRYGGLRSFHFFSRIWARIDRSASQVLCVARPD